MGMHGSADENKQNMEQMADNGKPRGRLFVGRVSDTRREPKSAQPPDEVKERSNRAEALGEETGHMESNSVSGENVTCRRIPYSVPETAVIEIAGSEQGGYADTEPVSVPDTDECPETPVFAEQKQKSRRKKTRLERFFRKDNIMHLLKNGQIAAVVAYIIWKIIGQMIAGGWEP